MMNVASKETLVLAMEHHYNQRSSPSYVGGNDGKKRSTRAP